MQRFGIAYTKCIATLRHDRIYLFVHWRRAPVMWSGKPHMYALRTCFDGFRKTPSYFHVVMFCFAIQCGSNVLDTKKKCSAAIFFCHAVLLGR